MKKTLTEMLAESEALEAARLAGELICPLSRKPLRIIQGRRSKRWFAVPCLLGCKGCDLPIYWFDGWETKEALLEHFRKKLLVEELI